MTVNKPLPKFLRHVMYTLRGGFLVRPLIIALTLGGTGAFLSMLEAQIGDHSGWLPFPLFTSRADPQMAQVILSDIATSMMTVVSIVFAILLMSLTLASMQFSPRIIVSFARDRVTQQTLGIFLGTFSYCLSALPAAHSVPHPFAPVFTVLGAMLLALLCVAWLLYFIHHISQAISANHIVDRIALETEAIIDQTMPRPLRSYLAIDTEMSEPGERAIQIVSDVSGYVCFIETDHLVSLAKSYGVTVSVLRRVGHFVPEGVPLLTISKGDKVPAGGGEFLSAFDLGPTRTLQMDIEFGILQIVDIALKAISPAVNDPSTAISSVDQLSRILIRFASREPSPTCLYDPPGIVRVRIPQLGFDRLVEAAFEQIRSYARADIAVNLRMLRALSDIAMTTPIPEYRQAVVKQGRRIFAGCAERFEEEDLKEMRVRLQALEKFA